MKNEWEIKKGMLRGLAVRQTVNDANDGRQRIGKTLLDIPFHFQNFEQFFSIHCKLRDPIY